MIAPSVSQTAQHCSVTRFECVAAPLRMGGMAVGSVIALPRAEVLCSMIPNSKARESCNAEQGQAEMIANATALSVLSLSAQALALLCCAVL